MTSTKDMVRNTILILVAIIIFIALCVGGLAGCKSFNRAQKRADANNQVKVTHIMIQRANQQAQINRAQIAATKAEAEKRFQEAVGIRRAQDEISKTLTDKYLQHEAIQAMERMAASGRNNTAIYLPSGDLGVPLVNDISKVGK
jgi:biopolymer transport protein ExbB/TolQ